jgi:type I restriction enzyme S subunit
MSVPQNKKYPAYKDSGVEWLGEIPESWEYIRMKRLYWDFSKKNHPEAELLSVTQNQGVVPRTWVENRMVMPSGALESFKFINKGDFAISLRSFEGGLEYCHHDGIISPAYTVLKKKRNDLIEGYYKYLFKSYSFISELQTSVVGIREGKNISYPELSYSYLPVPTPTEQTAIANFLDDKITKIDQAIAQKEKMIALLKERKQIVIQNAVTKGLDPNVKMKDSGVEWIGEVPEHWLKRTKIKFISSLKGRQGWQGLKADEYKDEGPHVLSSAHFNNYIIDWDKCPRVSYERYLMDENIQLKIGDVLLMKDGAKMGKLALVEDLPGPACLNSHLLLFRPLVKDDRQAYIPKFLFYHMMCTQFQDYVKVKGTGTTFLGISQESIGNYPVCLPSTKEQDGIVRFLEDNLIKFDQAISLQQTQIEKLKEYKATLIDSAVTGKIKVSET